MAKTNIVSRRELEEWLDDAPREWSQAIAVRTALRFFPLAFDQELSRRDRELHSNLTRAACRACLVSSVASRYPSVESAAAASRAFADGNVAATNAYRTAAFRTSVAAAKVNRAAAAAHAASYAARAAASGAHAAAIAAANAADAAARAIQFGPTDVWKAVQADCRQLRDGTSPKMLLADGIWSKQPAWWGQAQTKADRLLGQEHAGSGIWAQWYRGRISGSAFEFADFDDDRDREFASRVVAQTDDWWSNWPKVNSAIANWVKELSGPTASGVDYFISYADEEEKMAREVASVIEDLGHTYVVQYRDFPRRNLVTAINDGLASARTLVSLYSKAYVRSKRCQVEWNHYFTLDPSSEERRIVPFLLEPTDLKPLMRQIVYCDLAGLGLTERRAKIREWLEWKPPTISRDWVSEVVQRTLSPQIEETEDGRFDAVPDPYFDQAEFPCDLSAALTELRMLLDVIREDAMNLPRIMRSAVMRYDQEIGEVGADFAWGGLDRLVSIISDTLEGLDTRELPDGLEPTIRQFLEAHAKAMTALKDAGSRMRDLSSIPVDIQQAPGERLRTFVDKINEFFEELSKSGKTTARLEEHIKEMIDEGRDLAAEFFSGKVAERPDSAVRRYILSAGGLSLGALNILGASASISTTPMGQKLLMQAQELVDMFFRFIPM
ncbi:toll/interleukin-1 receptor domain-containing protein [Citromicrobium bathyomarinum]|uniref:toll/interleukin-1 receptor domain-containing protein n=1 Tax=Citromicrobium bathyomarinum TaxID=72174 RepID=UPI00315A72E6